MPKRRPLEDRLWEKVDKGGPVPSQRPDLGPCWLWTAATNNYGYGTIGTGEGKRADAAHRLVYRLSVGPIPHGLDLDHLCRVRHCVRPDHLEPVTRRTNLRRGFGISTRNAAKTACPSGHQYSGDNLVMRGKGRRCRTCDINRKRAARERGRASK